jgi:hypothetical protein
MPQPVTPEALIGPAAALEASAATNPRVADALAGGDAVRWGCAEDIRKLRMLQSHLPQLPDSAVQDVYDRVVEAEAQVVGAARRQEDYAEGTAIREDELLLATFPGAVLLEAQHATDPVRKATGKRGGADHGTGGLALVLAEDMGAHVVIPRGRQTGNANVDPEHPLKDELRRAAATGEYEKFFSVHGCFPGKVLHPMDVTEIHGVIGLGTNPAEADIERAEALRVRVRDELGLRLITGNLIPHLNYAKDPDWDGVAFRDRTTQLDRKDGQVATSNLASLMPGSTVTMMRTEAGLPSSQIELSRSVRLLPEGVFVRDPSAAKHAVYMGYQICRMAIEG